MGNCALFFDEFRSIVSDPEHNHIYIFIRGEGDCPFQVLGWHYKAFPATVTTMDVLRLWTHGEEDPLRWERKNPPPTVPNWEMPDLSELFHNGSQH